MEVWLELRLSGKELLPLRVPPEICLLREESSEPFLDLTEGDDMPDELADSDFVELAIELRRQSALLLWRSPGMMTVVSWWSTFSC